jgi:hypothetical protein
MVCWNDVYSGIPLEPDPRAHGLSLSCMACGHSAVIRHTTALDVWRRGTSLRDVARSLVCSTCGKRQGRVMLAPDYRQPANRTEDNYWNGTSYPEVTVATIAALRR